MRYLCAKARRKGAILPLVAICMVAMLAITGLVIDGGLLMTERRHAQNVADGGAMAAAVDLLNSKGLAQAVKSAYEYADGNGYHTDSSNWNFVESGNPPSITSTRTLGDTRVTVNIPPLSGQYTGNRDYVEVIGSRTLNPFFIQVAGGGRTQVSARAVAGVKRRSAPPYGMIALNKKGNGVQINGTGGFTIQAPVLTLSTDPNSLWLGGSPSATSTGPLAGWFTNGGYGSGPVTSWTDGTTIPAGPLRFTPTPTSIPSTIPLTDPLVNIPPPPKTGLSIYPAVTLSDGLAHTLNPGIYAGGIKVTGNTTVTLNPGLYYIDGGGVQIGTFITKPLLPGQVPNVDNIYPVMTDTSSMIANKVTFYNSGTTSTFGPFLLSYYGSRTVVTPPDQLAPGTALDYSKGYPGMSLFQDRDNSGLVWLFNQLAPLSGTFYAASGVLRFNGQGINPANPLQLVDGRIIIDTDTPGGNAESDVPYDAKVFAPPPEIYLVE